MYTGQNFPLFIIYKLNQTESMNYKLGWIAKKTAKNPTFA